MDRKEFYKQYGALCQTWERLKSEKSEIEKFPGLSPDAAEKKRLIMDRLSKTECQCLERLQEILETIEKMPDGAERDVLYYRYVKGLIWSEIAETMGYSQSQVHRIHIRALKH